MSVTSTSGISPCFVLWLEPTRSLAWWSPGVNQLRLPPWISELTDYFIVSHNLGSETKRATGTPLYMAIGQCGTSMQKFFIESMLISWTGSVGVRCGFGSGPLSSLTSYYRAHTFTQALMGHDTCMCSFTFTLGQHLIQLSLCRKGFAGMYPVHTYYNLS